jgi:polyisoprenoid-binding protein YceI
MKRPSVVRPAVLVPLALLALGTAALSGGSPAWSAPAASTWEGDTVHSYVLFKAKHLGTSWNYGRFNDFTVSVTAGDGGAEVSAVAFTVKAESVDTGQAKRDQHLKSPDFFSAKQFPEISFKSTAAKAIDADTTEVTGDLSFHGVTKPVTAKVVRVGGGKGMKGEEIVGYESVFTIKRSDFGVGATFGAAVLSDEVTLTVAVEGTKK